MGRSEAKLFIEKELLGLQLNLENNYKEEAYDAYLNVSAMVESFYDQGEISRWSYKKFKKALEKYDEMYNEDKEDEVVASL